ncbi:MAG: hypothetical protein Sapg2KO_45510 [Saprospiraceae bacterium]
MIVLLVFVWSCNPDQPDPLETDQGNIPGSLPFTALSLTDFSGFEKQPENWAMAGAVFVDRSAEMKMEHSPGSGIIVNTAPAPEGADLFSAFEHGDIELELDVMVPRGSNSGIYFQGRYEIQVFDSWGVEDPQHLDMGGIYQRWDDSKPEETAGYEGHAPAINAAKSPGLWQHYKILFHAPKFDASGNKIQNASFEEVWLNGVKIHENVSLTGPTRAAAFEDEDAMGPLMLQGDHGPVAYRNIRYKKYDGIQLEPQNLVLTEYGNEEAKIPSLDSLMAKSSAPTDSITYQAGSIREKFLLAYEGQLKVPNTGTYVFHLNTARAATALIIGQDTIVQADGEVGFNVNHRGVVALETGSVPFQLLYNKHCCPWARGFSLEVEGPGVQRHALTTKGSAFTGNKPSPIYVAVEEEPVLQRGFLMHDDIKLTHVASVGTPAGVHYSYDLAMGSLLQVWGGEFLDVTDMWHARGQRQLSKPRGSVIDFHGEPNVFALADAAAIWPDSLTVDQNFKPVGYEIDDQGYPAFIYETNGVEVRNEILPSEVERRMTRKISLSDGSGLWTKIDEGSSIKLLADGSYAVNDYEYFVELADDLKDNATIRDIDGQQELLIQLQSGAQTVQYDIIW